MKYIFFDINGLAADIPNFDLDILQPLQEDPDTMILFLTTKPKIQAMQELKDNGVFVNETFVIGIEDMEHMFLSARIAAEESSNTQPLRGSIELLGFDPEAQTDEMLQQRSRQWIQAVETHNFRFKCPSILTNPTTDSILLVESDSAHDDRGTLRRDQGMQQYPTIAQELGYSLILTPEAPTAWHKDAQGFTQELKTILASWQGQPLNRDLGKQHRLYREGHPPPLGMPRKIGKER